jgi:UDP-N-acetyl-D-mannosaminuronate dehydrogenase
MEHTEKTLAVVGLGYVGLPLAVQAAQKGYTVTGIDINEPLLRLIEKRKSPYASDTRNRTTGKNVVVLPVARSCGRKDISHD